MLAESTPERTAARHILAWLAFVLLVLYTIFIGGSGHGIYLVALRTASLAVIALILAGWFVVSLRLPHWRPTTAIWPTPGRPRRHGRLRDDHLALRTAGP